MTREKTAEVIELFALAYPYAEIFKAESAEDLRRKQTALITIWTAALPDVEDWIAVPAARIVLRTSKFMPSIAEFKEAADELQSHQDAEAREAFLRARDAILCFPGKEEKMMGPRAWTVVQAMGGIEAFAPEGKCFNLERFEDVYKTMLRNAKPSLQAGRALEGRR